MKYSVFYKNILDHLSEFKTKNFPEIPNGTFRGNTYSHIFDETYRDANLLCSNSKPDIKYHDCSHHLNSSQIMCINFFSPFISNEPIFLDLLNQYIDLPKDCSITKAEFEYTPFGTNNTNFDFYIELSTGERSYLEIKYTEPNFGKTSYDKNNPNKYEDKWKNFYARQLEKSLYLKNISQEDFYNDYQINRNIAYIQNEKDYVIFLYPFDHQNLHSELATFDYKNVLKINWHEITNNALALTMGTDLHNHFIKFKEKYLDYSKS